VWGKSAPTYILENPNFKAFRRDVKKNSSHFLELSSACKKPSFAVKGITEEEEGKGETARLLFRRGKVSFSACCGGTPRK